MTSGGDAQIVWTAIKMGLCAGISPELGLTHYITRNKANHKYICRMAFGVMKSGQIALVQAFPEEKQNIEMKLPSKIGFLFLLLLESLKIILLFRLRSGPVSVVTWLGEWYGKYIAADRCPPLVLRLAAHWLS
jgi:hypothetical protein